TTPYPLVADCRFALVLAEIGPVLRRNGVRVVEFSNSHAYRNTHFGKLSLHANGLALDLHRIQVEEGDALSVQEDFRRRLGARGCREDAPALNRLACELRATGLFSELLTPDYNADHRDHFHLGIARKNAPFDAHERGGLAGSPGFGSNGWRKPS
ncbi:MAG TPA: extensin family protein, partial [Polyangiaceae bacterium]|nr:extensin family protein [Polyangiaceae bacterium]